MTPSGAHADTLPADITVVIPLFNRAALIGATLDAVLAQTLLPKSVIVVDDGSTDGSADVAENYGTRVRVIRNGKQGVQAARNIGIEQAPTEWIALCDSDDLWEPGWLAQTIAVRAAAPPVDFVFGNFRLLQDGRLSAASKFDDAPAGYWDEADAKPVPGGMIFGKSLAGLSFTWHPIFPSAMTFSKSLLKRAGVFDTRLKGRSNEDGEFTLRLLYHATAAAVTVPLVHIRKHRESVSADKLKLLIDEIWSLDFVQQHHEEARCYHDVIRREIVRRTIQAADLAFTTGDHAMVRRLVKDIPPSMRPTKLRMKHVVASLPASIARPTNSILQRIAGQL